MSHDITIFFPSSPRWSRPGVASRWISDRGYLLRRIQWRTAGVDFAVTPYQDLMHDYLAPYAEKIVVRDRGGKLYLTVGGVKETTLNWHRRLGDKIRIAFPHARMTSAGFDNATWRLNP